MANIHILDEATINQIAAGEVIERPGAVVKELVENSIDAGSSAITVEIKDGGISLIRVTDNGAGINGEDIRNAFLRHATSKIITAEDLLSVSSLGFRGEALSSIAAVAQVELITKTEEQLNGFRYIIEGGDEKTFEEIGCPSGTTIVVRNLFYNTPARRKFLKSAAAEAGHINDLMERLMVSHPHISMKFIVNNQVKLQSSGNNSRKDILYQVYGRDIINDILPVSESFDSFKISGFIGKPAINRGNRNYENYFINGRYIKSNIITAAIEAAYKPFLMQHKYPFTSLYYEIDPSDIDVNVHPQKLEVRLKNGDSVYHATMNLIRHALSGKEMIPRVSEGEAGSGSGGLSGKGSNTSYKEGKDNLRWHSPEPFEANRRMQLKALEILAPEASSDKSGLPYLGNLAPGSSTGVKSSVSDAIVSASDTKGSLSNVRGSSSEVNDLPSDDTGWSAGTMESERDILHDKTDYSTIVDIKSSVIENTGGSTTEQLSLFSGSGPDDKAPFLSKQAFAEHRIIGQVFSTYWLIEYNNELFIIDQHAAHEKVLYERIMAGARNKEPLSQLLMPPIILTLNLREQEILKGCEEFLNGIGYEFEHFGGNEFSVRAVPSDLYGLSEKELILEFLDELGEEYKKSADPSSILEKTASLSCKAAVKANHTLSFEEASALIKELLTLENPYHCPHGRPVIVSMSRNELERRFKRII